MELFEWYIIRATGTAAYVLLYLAVLTGLLSQVQKRRKKKVTSTLLLHESLSNWALILTCGHVLFLLIDSYISFRWFEVLLPFKSHYKMLPMALGSLALYFFILTVITSKARKKIGYQKWRKLHALNPILYGLVTIHGLFIGSDFSGSVIAVANIIPLFIIGIVILFDRKKAPAIQQ